MARWILVVVPVCVIAMLLGTGAGLSPTWAEEYRPKIADASDEGERGLARIRVPEGMAAKLVAAEPRLANPVAFWIDGRGRFYVCETFRQGNAVTDNRERMYWLDDDLAARTVADRLAYHQKHLKEKLVDFTKEQDRIRLLEDRDGDGVVDADAVFSTGYNEVVEGTGAGVLEHRGNVYYTNIPHLWKLRDTNGDGVADDKVSLQSGYGVRVAFRGHDMHGLTMGPDGRVYFSIGDRGFHVTHEGQTFDYPEQGAVLRCEPDGSGLEVVHLGLRNPQELAFDEFGRLFTGDNNSDGGDQARWVQIVDGGESGWRMYYQYVNDRGPWNREKLWQPRNDGQPAYIVPPITNLANGPSGLAYYPGVGLPERFQQHFFLCDFRGQDANSGIRTFALKPKGASFEVVDAQESVWSVLATDCDFGPDGALYLTDWVEGWNGPGKGRIYKVEDSAFKGSSDSAALKSLFAAGFTERSIDELVTLLAHPHFRVRLEAQWALAERGAEGQSALVAAATNGATTQAKLHGVWGVGQLARKSGGKEFSAILPLLTATDSHVRAQAVRVIGEAAWKDGVPALRARLTESDPQVLLEVLNALGRVGDASLLPDLIAVLDTVNDGDAYLRNAAAVALSRVAQAGPDRAAAVQALIALHGHASPAVRRGAVLALRRLKEPGLAKFLGDADLSIVQEAALAIHDLPVLAAYEPLAALASRSNLTEATWWRVVNANYRLNRASAVAGIAARSDVPRVARLEAVRALGQWAKPSGRDRVLGDWRPLAERSGAEAKAALRTSLGTLLAGDDEVRKVTLEVGVQLGLEDVGPALAAIVSDTQKSNSERSGAMAALGVLKSPELPDVLKLALKDDVPAVRAAARTALARTTPTEALPVLTQALATGTPLEIQAAIRALPLLSNAEGDARLLEQLGRLARGELPAEARLDALEVAQSRGGNALTQAVKSHFEKEPADDLLRGYRETLAGGDAERGRRLFFEKSEVSCSRCHVAGGHGGEVGPNLSKIGGEKPRDYLLTAIVHPDHEIAKGFETLVVETSEGLIISGIVKQESATHLSLVTPEAKRIDIAKADIVEQARGKSGMPADLVKKLTREELRDLVEYLASQRGK
jgi:quinoprotein glucose dehydrogenase